MVSYLTTVAADASSYSLGAVLAQKQSEGEQRSVAYISRSLTETNLEKEAQKSLGPVNGSVHICFV